MYDIAVIGLGPAGIEAVRQALRNDLSVIAFNDGILGGTCLNVGCIPTKSILHSAVSLNRTKRFDEIGILCSSCSADWNKIISRSRNIVDKFVKSLNLYFKKEDNFKYVNSPAELYIENDYMSIQSDFNVYEAKNIIIATGSKPRNLESIPFDGNFILSSDDLFNLDKLPQSMAIVGSGAVGCEWAYILSSFGVKVYLIEKENCILPAMDIDIQKTAERILKSVGVEIYKNSSVESCSSGKLILSSGQELVADKVLSAVGRVPVLPDIYYAGYEGKLNLKAEFDYTTDFENLYVVGDATGTSMLAHSARYAAKSVISRILQKEFKYNISPSVVYLDPEIASMGINEQNIDESYSIKKMNLASLQKAWCDDATLGFIKLIIKDNFVKGAHIVSNEASSLISILSYIISYEIPLDEAKDMIYPHPSYSELIDEVLSR